MKHLKDNLVGFLAALAAWLVLANTVIAATPGVTVAVTGDVYSPDAKIVADAILDHPAVSAVLLAGDTCNATVPTLASYRKLYHGTFDRFLAKIHPCPGNHDGLSWPAFSGYGAFWGPAAHSPERYYSFDLGGWHIISLDSVTLGKGGVAAAAQLRWLKADLALKPQTPILAFWHCPLFSNAKHRGDPKMKSFWEAIHAHGPALVINGHNHVYERFAPKNPDGVTVPEKRGLQQFAISPGGAGPARKAFTKVKGPSAEKFHSGAHHAGFFTLYADGGFNYTIQSISHQGVRVVVDQGAGNLLGGPKPVGD